MSQTSVFSGGIALLTNSPFKQTLHQDVISNHEHFDVEAAVKIARDEDILYSDVGKFLKQRDQVQYEYYNKINDKCLKQDLNLISGSLHEELMSDSSSSHLKIKLLSEYALSKIDKDDKLLELDGLLVLDNQVEELKQEKLEIISQLDSNNTLLSSSLLNLDHGSSGANEILKTSLSSHQSIVERLNEVNDALQSRLKLLNNQYLLVLSLCYFEDLGVKSAAGNNNVETHDRETEELMSYIVSTSVQRGITLPAPNPEASKSQWAKSCLDALISDSEQTQLSSSATLVSSKDVEIIGTSEEKGKDITKLKTALEDLQFAHQYLTRQFQEERDLNQTTMDSHNKKKNFVEKELLETLALLEKANQRTIAIENEKSILETKIDEKINIVNELKRQVTNLKIENLGFVHSNDRISLDKENILSPANPERMSFFSPTSPLTGIEVQVDDSSLNPKTPLLQKNNSNVEYKFQSPSTKYNSSISVLRSEFKKLVNEMHTNFEAELAKEKNEKNRLENLVKIYEERNNDIDLL